MASCSHEPGCQNEGILLQSFIGLVVRGCIEQMSQAQGCQSPVPGTIGPRYLWHLSRHGSAPQAVKRVGWVKRVNAAGRTATVAWTDGSVDSDHSVYQLQVQAEGSF